MGRQGRKISVACSHSRTQALSICHPWSPPPDLLNLAQDEGEERIWRIGQEVLWNRPEGGIYYLCSCNNDENSVTWLHLPAREAGKCGLSLCTGQKENGAVDNLPVSAPAFNAWEPHFVNTNIIPW